MFERFTPRARRSVLQAVQHARRLDSPTIGSEHLLLGLLDNPDSLAAQVLSELGADPAELARRLSAELTESHRRAGLAAADAAALADLGIDVESVVRHAEESFGPGALAPYRPVRCSRRPGRVQKLARLRKPGPRKPGRLRKLDQLQWQGRDHRPMRGETKKVLERCLTEARDLRHNYIGTEHVLLAILGLRHGPAWQVLASYDIDQVMVRAQVVRLLRQAS